MHWWTWAESMSAKGPKYIQSSPVGKYHHGNFNISLLAAHAFWKWIREYLYLQRYYDTMLRCFSNFFFSIKTDFHILLLFGMMKIIVEALKMGMGNQNGKTILRYGFLTTVSALLFPRIKDRYSSPNSLCISSTFWYYVCCRFCFKTRCLHLS